MSVVVAHLDSGHCHAGSLPVPVSSPAPVASNASADSGQDFVPSLACDGTGRWICAWQSGDTLGGTVGTDNDIFVAASADDGQTWSAVKPLNTTAATDGINNDRNVCVATDRAGTWIAVWMSNNPLGGTVGDDIDILMSRSTDNGVTWTSPSALNANASSDFGNDFDPVIAYDGAGVWIAVWRTIDTLTGTIGADGDILVSRSTNGGQAWTFPVPLNTNATSDSDIDLAPQLATNGSGLWMCVWQSRNDIAGAGDDDEDIHIARSLDHGVTWSPPALLNSNAAADESDTRPHILFAGGLSWKVTWMSYDDLNGTIGADADILFSKSDDDGVTWSPVTALNTNAATDTGDDMNPRLGVDSQQRWICAWHSNDALNGTIGTDNDILIATSDDFGVTWNAAEPLCAYAATDAGTDEFPVILSDLAGAWLVAWETRANPGGLTGTDRDIIFARFAMPDCNENTLPDAREVDCNDNASPDDCDIDDGTSVDLNGNGIPDECDGPGDPCPADINNSGTVNIDDLLAVINSWGPTGGGAGHPADIAPPGGNGVVNIDDLLAVINGWGACD
jgi:hypothetical protein